MDDLEICKRIAEIEGYEVLNEDIYKKQIYIKSEEWCNTDSYYFDTAKPYMPIWHEAMMYELMIKYKVRLSYFDDGSVDAWIESTRQITAQNVTKAICLAIIEVHKELTNEL
tara:strand:+ start:34 stop:369 length:336 start_codon:yes stop_codon:yes gene_type:complete